MIKMKVNKYQSFFEVGVMFYIIGCIWYPFILFHKSVYDLWDLSFGQIIYYFSFLSLSIFCCIFLINHTYKRWMDWT